MATAPASPLLAKVQLLCLLCSLFWGVPRSVGADEVTAIREAIQAIENEWAVTFYQIPPDQQTEPLEALLVKTQQLGKHHPGAAEPLIMEAIIRCSLAASDIGLGSLGQLDRAKELLTRSLSLDPLAMQGSAYITLGNLYYRLPGWPISFGNEALARSYLETALRHFPYALDANYFYGDFLLEQGEYHQALPFLERAEKAPVRPNSRLSDQNLKREIKEAVKDAREAQDNRRGFFGQLLMNLFSGLRPLE